jgi:hypothetical protein
MVFQIAMSKQTTAEQLHEVAIEICQLNEMTGPWKDVLHAILRHDNTSNETLEYLYDNCKTTRFVNVALRFVKAPHITPELIERMLDDYSVERIGAGVGNNFYHTVANKAVLTDEALKVIVHRTEVTPYVFGNANLTAKQIGTLWFKFKDDADNQEWCYRFAEIPNTPDSILDALAFKLTPGGLNKTQIDAHLDEYLVPRVSESTLKHMISVGRTGVYRYATLSDELTDILFVAYEALSEKRLWKEWHHATFNDWFFDLAKNPNASSEVIDRIVEIYESAGVLNTATGLVELFAKHPNVSYEATVTLCNADRIKTLTVGANVEKIARSFATQKDVMNDILYAVLSNSNLSEELLYQTAKRLFSKQTVDLTYIFGRIAYNKSFKKYWLADFLIDINAAKRTMDTRYKWLEWITKDSEITEEATQKVLNYYSKENFHNDTQESIFLALGYNPSVQDTWLREAVVEAVTKQVDRRVKDGYKDDVDGLTAQYYKRFIPMLTVGGREAVADSLHPLVSSKDIVTDLRKSQVWLLKNTSGVKGRTIIAAAKRSKKGKDSESAVLSGGVENFSLAEFAEADSISLNRKGGRVLPDEIRELFIRRTDLFV